MRNVYINYPNARISVHSDPNCAVVRSHHKEGQRIININPHTEAHELRRFDEEQHRFASEADFNDMWVIIDYADDSIEDDVVNHIWRALANRYTPFRGIDIEEHCA